MAMIGACSRLVLHRLGVLAAAVVMSPPFSRLGAEPAPAPVSFPANYDFPLSADVLRGWIGAADESKLRRHGWYLWAGINQPGSQGWPIWASWNTATQVFAPAPRSSNLVTARESSAVRGRSLAQINKRNRANAPINLDADAPIYIGSTSLKDGARFQSNEDVMLATEAYSQDGYNWIRDKALFERGTLDSMHKNKLSDIPNLPRTSIVLKHMYWPVKGDGLTALPVVNMALYDKQAIPDTTYVGFENQRRWSRAVAIDPSRSSIPPDETASVTYLYDVLQPAAANARFPIPMPLGPLTYSRAKVVSIDDFYHKRLSMSEFNAMDVDDQRLINASFYWAHKRPFKDGDYLVSIASHIVTKEVPGWTLQSVWWSDEPNATKYAKDRPPIADARGPWQHYLLVVEDGASKGNTVPIAYNPYIELAAHHPVATNCRNCHLRADTPHPQYVTLHGPPALANLKPDDPIFKDELRTDFLWTITDRALPPPP